MRKKSGTIRGFFRNNSLAEGEYKSESINVPDEPKHSKPPETKPNLATATTDTKPPLGTEIGTEKKKKKNCRYTKYQQ